MLQALTNIFKIPELRNKILFFICFFIRFLFLFSPHTQRSKNAANGDSKKDL